MLLIGLSKHLPHWLLREHTLTLRSGKLSATKTVELRGFGLNMTRRKTDYGAVLVVGVLGLFGLIGLLAFLSSQNRTAVPTVARATSPAGYISEEELAEALQYVRGRRNRVA